MSRVRPVVDRLWLDAEIRLHRHGPWWPILGAAVIVLGGLALAVLPGLEARLAARQEVLRDLLARVALQDQAPVPEQPAATANYHAYRAALADSEEVLPAIQRILDSAQGHRLQATRAEYQRSRDVAAQAEAVQMIVPVRGRYADVRRWIEEILAEHPSLAVNEVGFRREDIASSQIEARVRLSFWHHPAGAGSSRHAPDP